MKLIRNNFNTTLVKVHQKEWDIEELEDTNFNTTLVKVHPLIFASGCAAGSVFQYNPC